jgi:ArsR family transcriptional regulator
MSMVVDVDVEPAAVLKALAEPQRWRILEQLATEELCVCHLVEELDLPQPLVSHHLRALREAGLVTRARHSYWTYYRLRPEALVPLAAELARFAADAPAPGERRRPCC